MAKLRVVCALTFSFTVLVGGGLATQAVAASNSVSRKFASCDELSKVWSSAIGRDDASRTRYIKYRRDNYYKDTHVVVRAGVYRRNSQLDVDKDGVICEEYFEQIDGIRRVFGWLDCNLRGGTVRPDDTCDRP